MAAKDVFEQDAARAQLVVMVVVVVIWQPLFAHLDSAYIPLMRFPLNLCKSMGVRATS